MKTREFTCIICPGSCLVTAKYEENGEILEIRGNACKKGEDYVRQELTDPQRTIASSCLLEGGELPLVSVRLNRPVPKDRVMDVMEEIRKVKLSAPVHMGEVVISDVLGLGSDVIATKTVGRNR